MINNEKFKKSREVREKVRIGGLLDPTNSERDRYHNQK
jgi:hypothetical protein